MSDYQVPTDWEQREDGKGQSGYITYRVPVSVYLAGTANLPDRGDPFYVPELGTFPYLRSIERVIRPLGGDTNGLLEIVYSYSTERELGEDFYEAWIGLNGETDDRTKGYIWSKAGYRVEQDIPSIRPAGTYNVRMRRTDRRYVELMKLVGRVNDKIFHGFAAGELMFIGFDTNETYDSEGGMLTVSTTYAFAIKDKPHNTFYRQPLPVRDAEGNILYWQNADATITASYTTDTSKIGTMVLSTATNVVDGDTYYLGQGGDDEPLDDDDNPPYPEIDFAVELRLPKQDGDE